MAWLICASTPGQSDISEVHYGCYESIEGYMNDAGYGNSRVNTVPSQPICP